MRKDFTRLEECTLSTHLKIGFLYCVLCLDINKLLSLSLCKPCNIQMVHSEMKRTIIIQMTLDSTCFQIPEARILTHQSREHQFPSCSVIPCVFYLRKIPSIWVPWLRTSLYRRTNNLPFQVLWTFLGVLGAQTC